MRVSCHPLFGIANFNRTQQLERLRPRFISTGKWWLVAFPGLALMLAVLCFNLLGDGIRDILDPRMRT